ncbi:DUF4198 domain-containing protein [Roseisolibacter sp. H3M3-2]|uniref:DUF4198 domain-containing protein n=1 Tax=Roseisolibacter sp. H3M3-2 TaxID=3031323 RepID=UPI0023DB0903|nr:DUF4198 domain-containing protein [Roseisolibacter sp. H3M3-2]MDF1502597.1 DUF4198 domain-containing protein [Roseisolibacter sp. H3M3-2]
MRRPALPAALLFLAAPAAAAAAPAARDAWLVPARATLPPGVDAAFDLTTGPAFPTPASAVAAGRVTTARVRLGGHASALPAPRGGPHALHFRAPLREPGVATVWVSLAPRARTLDSADVVRLLDAVGAPDSVRLAYLRQLPVDGVRRWEERYAEHAVAHVLVSSPLRPRPRGDATWARPAGLPLELVPLADPTALRAGDSLDVRLLRRGRPLADAQVRAVGPDGRPRPARRTDADGVVTLPLAADGRWLVRATEIRRAGRDGGWTSDFATLTVVVR